MTGRERNRTSRDTRVDGPDGVRRRFGRRGSLALAISVLVAQATAADGFPWDDRSLLAEQRARMVVEQITTEE